MAKQRHTQSERLAGYRTTDLRNIEEHASVQQVVVMVKLRGNERGNEKVIPTHSFTSAAGLAASQLFSSASFQSHLSSRVTIGQSAGMVGTSRRSRSTTTFTTNFTTPHFSDTQTHRPATVRMLPIIRPE